MRCIIENCPKEEKTRGYCSAHYQKYRKTKNFQKIYTGRNICNVENCKREVHGNGYCTKHNYKFKKYGNPFGGFTYRRFEKHGKIKSSEYSTYTSMLSRCYDPKNKNFHRYGGRGIVVCDRWLHSFKNFLEDMGEKPFLGAQIDRANNNGNYEPSNCRWVDNKTNSRNRNNTVVSVEKAEKIKELRKQNLTYAKIAEQVGVHIFNVRDVIRGKSYVEV